MIIAGVDEAGYGPILGPLCIGAAAFRAAPGTGEPEAAAAVARALDVSRHGVRVADSKAVHSPSKGPRALEETVLAFLVARDGEIPADGAALHLALGVGAPTAVHRWYASLPTRPLPLAARPDLVLERGRALAAVLAEEGLALESLRVRALSEGRYNEEVERRGNKATVLFDATAALLGPLLDAAGDGPASIVCDRHGARGRYAPLLQEAFPERLVRVLGERAGLSAYAVGSAQVTFREKADASVPAVALASMLAKYLRESWMAALNGWFLGDLPKVRPTAGYWTDGLRFLSETAELRRRLGVDDGVLVRVR